MANKYIGEKIYLHKYILKLLLFWPIFVYL